MSYSNPHVVMYEFPSQDFGAGAGADSIKAPKGFTFGRIVDIGVKSITETFACDTTTGKIKVGTAGDDDAYATLVIADATAATDTFNTRNDTDAITATLIDASAQVEVAFVQCVDSGTAAGIAVPFLIVEWFN